MCGFWSWYVVLDCKAVDYVTGGVALVVAIEDRLSLEAKGGCPGRRNSDIRRP